MNNSVVNMLLFILSTIGYYTLLKPKLNYSILQSPEEYSKYLSGSYTSLLIYLVITIFLQVLLNIHNVQSVCGGSLKSTIEIASMYTIIPWFIIFGTILVVVQIFPGFKNAFSDVLGYYWVSNSANDVLVELLQNNPSDNENLTGTSDLIMKIFGNKSLLINQIVPNNFDKYWNLLIPLMKQQMRNDIEYREKLFNLVVIRDNIGEVMWYIYAGIMLVSLVQMKISAAGCKQDKQTMEQNYKKFLQQEQEYSDKKQKISSQTYTITN